MEQQTIEAASTSEAVNFITYVQGLKRKMKSWEKQVNLYREGQRILERQRFQFPSSWLHVDNIEVYIVIFVLGYIHIILAFYLITVVQEPPFNCKRGQKMVS
jgi:hypothetical protein